MDGVIVVNKPKDITSKKVVEKVKRIVQTKKAGHCGTLDPLATGVLPIFIGVATKTIPFMKRTDKEYLAEFKLGVRTDSYDVTGKVISQTKSFVVRKEIEEILTEFVGEIEQVPPMFSAVKKNGVALYVLARKGIEVERKARKIIIYGIECLNFNEKEQTGKLKICCSSGTYVREICSRLGEKLGVGGILTGLVRTMACGFKLENSVTLEELSELNETKCLQKVLISIENLFEGVIKIKLNPVQERCFLNGATIQVNERTEKEELAIVVGSRVLGMATLNQHELKVRRVF